MDSNCLFFLPLLKVRIEVSTRFQIHRLRCLSAKAWEDRPIVLRQINQIGEKSYVDLIKQAFESINGQYLQHKGDLHHSSKLNH